MADKKAAVEKDRSEPLVPSDFVDLKGFAAKLRGAADPFSAYLRGRLQPATRKMLTEFGGARRASSRLKEALADEINEVLTDSAMYDESRFAHVELSREARMLLQSRPQGKGLVRLNWMLIEEAYPTEILRNVSTAPKVRVERVQTGARLEKRMLKVLKALAELADQSLGELIEDIVLHAFDGVSTFDSPGSRERIVALKMVYGMDYDAHASYRFQEEPSSL